MLQKGVFKAKLKAFIKKVNESTQTDSDKAIDAFCEALETEIDERIRSITITIPPGGIVVQGSTGPASNATPIILTNIIK